MTQEKLNIILEKHKHWLNRDCEGWERMRADLSYADLTGLDFAGRDLRTAVLIGANLAGADLRGADFTGAILNHAIFIKADLARANLSYADLSWANLYRANLAGADLREANFIKADFAEAGFSGANLAGADLRGTRLLNANLEGAINMTMSLACPSEGSFIAYKKSGVFEGSRYIIKLQIPEDAKRSSATTKKCRCDKAFVLAIENFDGTESDIKEIQSAYDSRFIYKVGEMVSVNDFDPCRWNECATGIHFFVDREEAVYY